MRSESNDENLIMLAKSATVQKQGRQAQAVTFVVNIPYISCQNKCIQES